MKKKRIFINVLIVCLTMVVLLLSISGICYGIVSTSGKNSGTYIEHIDTLTLKDVAIVPGTSVHKGVVTAKVKDRLLAAIELYEKGLVEQIVVSGDETEATAMARYLRMQDIPAKDIYCDEHGMDTYETITRTKEKLGDKAYYFCTQELYGNRAQYLMQVTNMQGSVVYVDSMYYNGAGRNSIREYFAATKAVVESIIYQGGTKKSIHEVDFITVPTPEEGINLVYEDEIPTPQGYRVKDENLEDSYDVIKAVEYAKTYALKSNEEYARFEQNCTNFVSQCLLAGGILPSGEGEILEEKRWNISRESTHWYSTSEVLSEDGLRHYSTTSNFINTDAFIRYFTTERGYEFTIYNNNREGKMQCMEDVASGDVLILYNEDGTVNHIGLISGIIQDNIYFCANTTERLDYEVFGISGEKYAQFGILHMSDKK